MAALYKEYPVLANLRLSEAETKARAEKDPAFREAIDARRREVSAAWDEANKIQGAKAKALEDDQKKKEEAQTRLAGYLSMASPLSDFTYWATELTSTGLSGQASFERQSTAWDIRYGEYRTARLAALQKKDPATDWWNTAVDVSDMPRFQYVEETLGARFKAGARPFAVLLAMVIAAFAAAYVSFLRTDPR